MLTLFCFGFQTDNDYLNITVSPDVLVDHTQNVTLEVTGIETLPNTEGNRFEWKCGKYIITLKLFSDLCYNAVTIYKKIIIIMIK